MSDRSSGNAQRVRIGLTGLAFVFVVVLLLSVFSRASDEEPITANRIEQAATHGGTAPANAAAPADGNEPLAELGVAPGKAPDLKEKTPETVRVEDPLRPQRRR